jgi:hypothetical protein
MSLMENYLWPDPHDEEPLSDEDIINYLMWLKEYHPYHYNYLLKISEGD